MSDLITINTNGLEEAIRCAICENTMKTDNGCDGNCRYDKNTFEKVKEAVNGCIVERPHGECKTCKHFVKDGFGGLKNVCEHPEIQLDDYYDYACIMMEDNDFCSRYEPREKEGDPDDRRRD